MFKYSIKFVVYLIVVAGFSTAFAGAYEDFFQAVRRGDAAGVQALLARGFDPNARDDKGQLALILALRDDAPGVASALLNHPQLDPQLRNQAGESALMMAALRGNLAAAQRLLDRGSPVQHEGWAPVHYAASAPDEKVLRLLLDRGAAVDARAPNGATALMMAANYGSEASVKLLLERGADPRLRSGHDRNAADFARSAGRDALARLLDAAAR